MKRLIILGIVICAGTLCIHLSAQIIEGKVTDASQQGIDGATVILQSADSVFIEATITDKEGNFHFRQKRENYCLTVIVWKLSIQSMATNTMSAKTSPEKVEATRIC